MASGPRECKPPGIRCMLAPMSDLVPLLAFEAAGWAGPWPEAAADALEQGAVVHFPRLVFELQPEERALVVRGLTVIGAKNISLDPASGRLGGVDAAIAPVEQLTRMMSRFRELARVLALRRYPTAYRCVSFDAHGGKADSPDLRQCRPRGASSPLAHRGALRAGRRRLSAPHPPAASRLGRPAQGRPGDPQPAQPL